ncbi:MAG: nucleoside triphosphate pyrophosphohydrolase [Chloroflexia bacterium]
MPARMTVVGLGPGRPEQLTREAWEVLQETPFLYLRTARHPVVAHFPPHIRWEALDTCFDGAEPGDAAERVVARLLQAAPPVVYGVPGSPWEGERTTRLLLQRLGAEQVRIVPGVGLLDTACAALEVDPLESGLQILDAWDLLCRDFPPYDPLRPLLVAHVEERCAAPLVRRLRLHYPAEHTASVFLVEDGGAEAGVVRTPLASLGEQLPPARAAVIYLPPLPPERALRLPATLEWICAKLRGPGGCPWDREQTHASLRNNLLEECYEVLDALDRGDLEDLRQELGDLLMQIFLHAQLAREEGAFDLGDVLAEINAKLIRRHPHVFGAIHAPDSRTVLRNWEAIKAAERCAEGTDGGSLLDGLPRALPALAFAQAVGRRVARVGFDWTRVEEVWAKVQEEMEELRRAETEEERAEELGDLLFALVNLARWLGIDAEDALRTTNSKFCRRFAWLESEAARRGVPLERMPMSDMDALWEEAKRREASDETG